jgi:hypothetical protein
VSTGFLNGKHDRCATTYLGDVGKKQSYLSGRYKQTRNGCCLCQGFLSTLKTLVLGLTALLLYCMLFIINLLWHGLLTMLCYSARHCRFMWLSCKNECFALANRFLCCSFLFFHACATNCPYPLAHSMHTGCQYMAYWRLGRASAGKAEHR